MGLYRLEADFFRGLIVEERVAFLKAAHPEVRYWLGGREREGTAFAIGSGIEPPGELPPRVSCLAGALKQHSALFGTGFAILMPRESSTNQP